MEKILEEEKKSLLSWNELVAKAIADARDEYRMKYPEGMLPDYLIEPPDNWSDRLF